MDRNTKNPLESHNFKNIGIDVDFIKENASEYNDKINTLYHGGRRDTETTSINEVIKRSDSQTQTIASGQIVQPKQSGEPKMELRKEEISQLVDKKVYDLAVKMQQYADQTDETIAQLKRKVQQLEQQLSARGQQTLAPQSTPQHSQSPVQSQPEQTKAQAESQLQADVSIEKMFNFSNNSSGKRQ